MTEEKDPRAAGYNAGLFRAQPVCPEEFEGLDEDVWWDGYGDGQRVAEQSNASAIGGQSTAMGAPYITEFVKNLPDNEDSVLRKCFEQGQEEQRRLNECLNER